MKAISSLGVRSPCLKLSRVNIELIIIRCQSLILEMIEMSHRGLEIKEGDLDGESPTKELSSSTCLSSFSSFRSFVELVRFTLFSYLHSIFSSLASRTSALLKDKKM